VETIHRKLANGNVRDTHCPPERRRGHNKPITSEGPYGRSRTLHEIIARACRNCDAPPEKHSSSKCLWEPTAYEPTGSPAAKKLIQRWRRSGERAARV
jgi:hypothetical protein